jgi:predicted acyltransferase
LNGRPSIASTETITQALPRKVAATAAAAARLVSLDVFRGLTIAGMILVNNPGSWSHIYWPLEHAAWNGWTPTDTIFPFFLFIVGVSMMFSFAARIEHGATRAQLALHVLRRSSIIFAIGLFLNGFPYFHLSRIRIPGVLQRIAVCYLFAGLIVLAARRPAGSAHGNQRLAPAVYLLLALLVGYWALITFVPVPGYGVGRLDPEGNLGAYIDRKVMAGHLWSQSKTWDPEGILSTLPAIGTVLVGVLVGCWMRSRLAPQHKAAGLLAMGSAGMVLGKLLDPFFPINKNLWTSTYVIFMGGFAMVLLGVCYWLVDIKGYRRWAAPFLIYGMNSILVFSLSGLLAKASVIFKVTDATGEAVSWHAYVYDRFFEPLASPTNASLLFAISYVLLWLFLTWLLYRKRVFIKI